MVAVKAHFDGKVIIPDEPLALAADQRLIVHIEAVPDGSSITPSSFLTWAVANPIDDPTLPEDLSTSLDHYLNGRPKHEE